MPRPKLKRVDTTPSLHPELPAIGTRWVDPTTGVKWRVVNSNKQCADLEQALSPKRQRFTVAQWRTTNLKEVQDG